MCYKWENGIEPAAMVLSTKLRKSVTHAHARPNWLTQRLKNGIFTLLDTMNFSSTKNPLVIVNQVHAIYTQRMPHFMVSASIGTPPGSMQDTPIFNTGSGDDIASSFSVAHRLATSLCSDY